MKNVSIMNVLVICMIGLNALAMDEQPHQDQRALVRTASNKMRARAETRKELRFAIVHHKEETVKLLLNKAGKGCAGQLLRKDDNKYDSELFYDIFSETTPVIRDLVIECALPEDLGIFFYNTLAQFHETKENNKTNSGCYEVCGWVELVLCYFNKKNPLIYSLSDSDRSLLNLP